MKPSLYAAVLLLVAAAVSAADRPVSPSGVADPRLQKMVSVQHSRGRMLDIASDLSAATGVPFTVAPSVQDDAVTCLVQNRSASEVLRGLCDVMRYALRKEGTEGYRLELSPEVPRALVRLRQADEELTTQLAATLGALILRDVQADLAHPVDGKQEAGPATTSSGLREALNRLDADQLSALAAAAAQPTGIISAGDNHYLAERTAFYRPLSSYSPDFQLEIRTLAAGSPALQRVLGERADPQVGIVAHEGSLALAVVGNDGPGSLPPRGFGGLAATAAVAEADALRQRTDQWLDEQQNADRVWLDPREQALPNADHRNWSPMPVSLKLNVPADFERSDRVLADLAKQAGISVIADSFTMSTFVYNGRNLSQGAAKRPTAEWARQVATAFHRRYRCQSGLLLLRSRRYLWDRHVEVPCAVLDRLAEDKSANGRLGLESRCLAASALSLAQLHTLNRAQTDEGVNFAYESIAIERQRRLLAFLNTFREQIAKAPEHGMVSLPSTPPALRNSFEWLMWTGQPTAAKAEERSPADVSWDTERDEVLIRLRNSGNKPDTVHRVVLGPKTPPRSKGAGDKP